MKKTLIILIAMLMVCSSVPIQIEGEGEFTVPILGEEILTSGSDQSIKFKSRSMYLMMTLDEPGHLLFDITDPTNSSGQVVFVNESYLVSKEIMYPVFELGWQPLSHTKNKTHYRLDVPHFSIIGIHEKATGTVQAEFTNCDATNEPDIYVEAFTNITTCSWDLLENLDHWQTFIANMTWFTKVRSWSDPYSTEPNRHYVWRLYDDESNILSEEEKDWTFSSNSPHWQVFDLPDVKNVFGIDHTETYKIFVRGTTTGTLDRWGYQGGNQYLNGRSGRSEVQDYVFQIGGKYLNVTVDRSSGSITEVDKFNLTTSYYYRNVSGVVRLAIPVSTGVKAILNVTNTTSNIEATSVVSMDDLVNNTYYFDSANDYVHIGVNNISAGVFFNWSINCSYGSEFSISFPSFRVVGSDIFLQGTIKDGDGKGISGVFARSSIYFENGNLAEGPIEYNCTNGNFGIVILSTTSLIPGIYTLHVEFTDTASGIVFREGSTLYLSYPTPTGIYSDAMVYFYFYNTNEGLGLPRDTLKVYVNGARIIHNMHHGYQGQTINLTVKDYYNLTMYYEEFVINKPFTFVDQGLTFHSYKFANLNDDYYFISFLKEGGTRWFERGITPFEPLEFILPSGNYSLKIYDKEDNTLYQNNSIEMVNSKLYVLNGSQLRLVIDGQSVIVGHLLEVKKETQDIEDYIDWILTPDIRTICTNPPMVYSIYDLEGMAINNDCYQICPPLTIITTSKVNQFGNWINSSPTIPSNGTIANGTITILRDNLFLSGNADWVNITYLNGTVYQNTSYVPTKMNIYGESFVINASSDIFVERETKYNQERKFDWTYYPSAGYGPEPTRAGWHTAGIEVINPLSSPLYDVFVIAGFSNQSNPDSNTVTVTDTSNDGLIMERGPDFDVTGTSVHFFLLGMEANTDRAFTLGYYKRMSESFVYDEATKSIPDYQQVVWDGDSYNYFSVQWVNSFSNTFRGALYLKINFDVPTDIDTNSMRVFDSDNNQELTDYMFIPGRKFVRINSEPMGDVLPGSGRSFDVYFLMTTYPGGNPADLRLHTRIIVILGLPITLFLIFCIIGVASILIGLYLAIFGEKKEKYHWMLCVAAGIFIIVLSFVFSMKGA